MSGSHADSIILGGAYDGILGVLGPIAAVKALRQAGFRPRKSIEVVQWTSEEGDRFTEVCFGRCGTALREALPRALQNALALQLPPYRGAEMKGQHTMEPEPTWTHKGGHIASHRLVLTWQACEQHLTYSGCSAAA